MRGRIQEIEVDQIVDAERLEQKHHVAQIDALDLRHRVLLQFVFVRPGSVQAETLAGCYASGSSGALIGRRFRDGHHDQRLHSGASVVRVLLAETRVNHVDDVVDGQ